MNYIQHTRAAHQLLTQVPATPHHVSLYWALFFAWNAEWFPDSLALDHPATMRAARIGSLKTYRAALYDLHAWGLLTYQPSKSKYQESRCQLADLSGAEVPPVKARTGSKTAPGKTAAPGAEVPQALRAEVPPIRPSSGAEVPQDTLLSKTSFKTPHQNSGSTQKKEGEKFSGEGLSTVEVLEAPPDRPAAAPNAAAHQAGRVARKGKGVKQATIRAAAEAQEQSKSSDSPSPSDSAHQAEKGPGGGVGRRPRPEVPFADSDLATYEAFAAAFAGTDYAEFADLKFYHEKIASWRQKGEPPRRRDWKATATQFFLNDAHDNRLKLAPGIQRPDGVGGGPADAGIPASGYRSRRHD